MAAVNTSIPTPFSPTTHAGHHQGISGGSYLSNRRLSSLSLRPQPALAWADVRHQEAALLEEEEEVDGARGQAEGKAGESLSAAPEQQVSAMDAKAPDCQHAVAFVCLNLQHELATRDMGTYAGVKPLKQDSRSSMLKIMKGYGRSVQALSDVKINMRLSADPSRQITQHHLLRSRQLAGPDAYVLAIYIGHGIQEPPTEAGEFWVYDRSFEETEADGQGPSEYQPLVSFDFQSWAGASACFIWDVNHAGRIVAAAKQEAEEIDRQLAAAATTNPEIAKTHPACYSARQIHFAACQADQMLPSIPGLPADLFTACLIEPLKMAMLFHNHQAFPYSSVDAGIKRSAEYMELLWRTMSLDLKTRLAGELHSIVLAIAWRSLDSAVYHKLFVRSGEVISKVSAGFILAQRIMSTFGVQPVSMPDIPHTASGNFWTVWDLSMENLFQQLPHDLEGVEARWEEDIELLSFLKLQLNTVISAQEGEELSLDQEIKKEAALSRLPIVLQAFKVEQLQMSAVKALDLSLGALDLEGIQHAIRCGALDTASALLQSPELLRSEESIMRIVSIWAVLIKHEEAVAVLSKPVQAAEYMTDVDHIQFWLTCVQEGMEDDEEDKVVQAAAILSAILNFIKKKVAPQFLVEVLGVVLAMLEQEAAMVRRWGAILFAELVHGIEVPSDDHTAAVLQQVQNQLVSLSADKSVEVRAGVLHALKYWLRQPPTPDITLALPSMTLFKLLLPQAWADAAIQARVEMLSLLCCVLRAGPVWARLASWTLDAQKLAKDQEQHATHVVQLTKHLSAVFGVVADERRFQAVLVLMEAVKLCRLYSQDPCKGVSQKATGLMRLLQLHEHVGMVELEDGAEAIAVARTEGSEDLAQMKCEPKHTFAHSKGSLRNYIMTHRKSRFNVAGSAVSTASIEQQKTFAMRHRVLEDSMVLAEQQSGLPWKWHMKTLDHPDPWSNLSLHSFSPLAMSTANSKDLHVWDWSADGKKGVLSIDTPGSCKIKSARFINELYQSSVILAESSNGHIHVFTGPPEEPHKIRSISSFLGLDLRSNAVEVNSREHRRLRTTWWRSSGLLGVGGSSPYINIFDCPAEQRIRVFETEETFATTTLITEAKSGNIILGGFDNGIIKLFDLRSNRKTAVVKIHGDQPGAHKVKGGMGIKKLGVVLGESRTITAACTNGLINAHDLRNLSSPVSSILAHPNGIAKATFQAHSGLMSAVSHLGGESYSQDNGEAQFVNWTIHRSNLSAISLVTQDKIRFAPQSKDVYERSFKPFTALHPLRPFLAIGYGRMTYLRGAGVGRGDSEDSGSYQFLTDQAKYSI